MNRINRTALTALITAAALALSSCGGQTADAPAGGTAEQPVRVQVSDAAREIANDYFPGDINSYAAWKDVDRSKIICSVSDPDPIPEFNVTFDEFISEYMYYLAIYGIEDDMSDDFYDDCKSYRVNIVNYLMFEKMYLYTARTEYNITPETLTKEQLDEVRETADGVRADWASNFYSTANEKLGENASDADIRALCDEVLQVILEKCGVTYDMFYQWELNSKIQTLTLEEMVRNVTVSDSDIDSELDTLRAHAKDAAVSDVGTYESMPTYQTLYIPEGTRKARFAVIPYSPESVEAISAAAETGNTDEVSKLIDKAYTSELRSKAQDIASVLASGVELDAAQADYRIVTDALVLKNSVQYDSSFVSALYGISEIGGTAEPYAARDGVYVIQYTGDAAISDSELEALRSDLRDYLKEQAETQIQMDAYNNWTSNYSYKVDCETLQIDESDVIQNDTGDDIVLDDFDIDIIE